MKEKVRLTEAQKTLLITLYAKARGCPAGLFDDEMAQRVLTQIDYDFAQLHVPTGTNLTVCLRAKKLDEYASAFPGCHLAFDAYSELTARRVKSHPSLKKTGATIQWGIDDPRTMETWGDGIQFQEEWLFVQSPHIAKLAFRHRLMFKLAGLFPVANKAHRILYFTL